MNKQNTSAEIPAVRAVVIFSRIFAALGVTGIIFMGYFLSGFAVDTPGSSGNNATLLFLFIVIAGTPPTAILPLVYARCVDDDRLPATIYFWAFSLAVIFLIPVAGLILGIAGIRARLIWQKQLNNTVAASRLVQNRRQ